MTGNQKAELPYPKAARLTSTTRGFFRPCLTAGLALSCVSLISISRPNYMTTPDNKTREQRGTPPGHYANWFAGNRWSTTFLKDRNN